MNSCRLIIINAIFILMLCPSAANAQYDDHRLIMRLADFSVITFEQKSPMGKGNFFTQSVYFQHRQNIMQTRTFSQGAVRLGYEKHKMYGKRIDIFGGSDLAVGYDLMNFSFTPDFELNLYGALGYEIGVNIDLGKRFAIGIQSAYWLKYSLPIRQIDEDNPFEFVFSIDPDWLSFNFVYKFKEREKRAKY